jgi:AAA domain
MAPAYIQSRIQYLALEGSSGMRNRVVAWRRRHLADGNATAPFYLIDRAIDLIAQHEALIAAIRRETAAPAAVVIDTLNRALVGDENSSADMARFIRAADTVRDAFGCAVVIVHHCGVAKGRPRGHTSLAGADDAQIAVVKAASGLATATVEHMKDGPGLGLGAPIDGDHRPPVPIDDGRAAA